MGIKLKTSYLALIAVVSLALAGCSGGGDVGQDSKQGQTSEAPVSEASLATAEDVAQALGVTDFAQSASGAPGASRWGEGTYEGSKIQIYEFANDEDYAVFLDAVKGFGIVESRLVKVGNVVVSVQDQTKTDAVRAELE